LQKGTSCLERQDFDSAIAAFTETIRLDPKLALAYYNRGWAYGNKGDHDTAIADYTEAIRLDPKLVAAYYNRGVAYLEKGDDDKAIADCTEAIRLEPKLAKAYNNRGVAYRRKGDSKRAELDFEEAKRLGFKGPAGNVAEANETIRGQAAQSPAQEVAPSPSSLSPKDAETAVLSDNSVYEKIVPSVVIIFSFRGATPIKAGSGFVLDRGHRVIVTNEHVICGASIVRVRTHDGWTSDVTRVIAVDKKRDIAVLPLPQALAGMRGLRLAQTPPKVGDSVFALGSPKGLEFTFTKGIVSQFRRNFEPYGSVVQTDVSLSPGSSGSPLVDRHGQVVGVNTLASLAVAEAHNLNFAVSAEEIAAVCKRQEPCALSELKGFLEYKEDSDKHEGEAPRREAKRRRPILGAPPTPSVIESQIDGDFEGWEGETIVKLTNGQIWQQNEYQYEYCYESMPEVLIYRSGSVYKMKVEGTDEAVEVVRLK